MSDDSLMFHSKRLIEQYDLAMGADHRSCFQDAVHCLMDKLERMGSDESATHDVERAISHLSEDLTNSRGGSGTYHRNLTAVLKAAKLWVESGGGK